MRTRRCLFCFWREFGGLWSSLCWFCLLSLASRLIFVRMFVLVSFYISFLSFFCLHFSSSFSFWLNFSSALSFPPSAYLFPFLPSPPSLSLVHPPIPSLSLLPHSHFANPAARPPTVSKPTSYLRPHVASFWKFVVDRPPAHRIPPL